MSTLSTLVKDLWKEQSRDEPDGTRCREILDALSAAGPVVADTNDDDGALFEKTLAASQKTFRLQRRKTKDPVWGDLLKLAESVLAAKQKQQETEESIVTAENDTAAADNDQSSTTLPSSTSQYLDRLRRQNKDLYKNPPVLPPDAVIIEKDKEPLPKRNTATGVLTFVPGKQQPPSAVKDFHPNTTPEEIIRGGAFGGTYFRSIHSAVTNRRYSASQVVRDTLDPDWYKDLDAGRMLTSTTYNVDVNKFKAKCGGSLGMWESSGWISDADPYGWFQWYCRFYQGRRCSDDARQIARWKGVAGIKGRFKSQLCNKILNSMIANGTSSATAINDTTISPVIRQTLFHWGLTITQHVLEQHKKR